MQIPTNPEPNKTIDPFAMNNQRIKAITISPDPPKRLSRLWEEYMLDDMSLGAFRDGRFDRRAEGVAGFGLKGWGYQGIGYQGLVY